MYTKDHRFLSLPCLSLYSVAFSGPISLWYIIILQDDQVANVVYLKDIQTNTTKRRYSIGTYSHTGWFFQQKDRRFFQSISMFTNICFEFNLNNTLHVFFIENILYVLKCPTGIYQKIETNQYFIVFFIKMYIFEEIQYDKLKMFFLTTRV